MPQTSIPAAAGSGDRTLYLYHTHTHETGRFTFKHNGQYDQNVLGQLNVFLADWRTKEPTHMAPELFDLIWEIYQEVGGSSPINIVSAYRSPQTNAMLRSASSGVAEHSQHMLGHAMDIFIPGISLTALRAAAMRHQVGGVGYYPTSGSPFVHVDVGSVRAWPRMTRAQLKKVFPDGKTLHLPTDGVPLSQDGRKYAMVQWSKCHMVPCNGGMVLPAVNDTIQVASLDPAQRDVPTIEVTAPRPAIRPASFNSAGDVGAADVPFVPNDAAPDAPVPARKSSTLMLATRDALPADTGNTALVALAAIGAPIPQPRVLLTPRDDDGVMMTAYASEIPENAGARAALQTLIERQTTASLPPLPAAPAATLANPELRTASLGGTDSLKSLGGLLEQTWDAMTNARPGATTVSALVAPARLPRPIKGLKTHQIDFTAPEIDHVDETLTTPVPMSDMHYADLYEPEGFLDHTAELGPLANRLALESDLVAPPDYSAFTVRAPMRVASN